MKLSTLISHSSELIRIIIKSYQASDRIASQYFRQKKYIGSKERRFISEITFSSLRNLSLTKHCTPDDYKENEKMTIIINLVLNNYYSIDKSLGLKSLFNNLPNYKNIDFNIEFPIAIAELINISNDEVEKIFNTINDSFVDLNSKIQTFINKTELEENQINLIASRYSMPEGILLELHNNNLTKRTWKDLVDIAESMNTSAPLTIRVNLNKVSRNDILKYLQDKEIDSQPTEISPAGITIKKRYQLTALDIYKSGLIEVQDEGSQLVAYALSPTKGSQVLDAAAGAGGKSLHLASLTDGKAFITASDIEGRRLKEFSKRLNRYDYQNIGIKYINPKVFTDRNIKKRNIFNRKFDSILIDSPCSGMGTARRMPMQKYRLSKRLLEKLQINQLKILNYYSQYLSPNGILVYATCSIMPDENEYVVDKFLKNNKDFEPDLLYPIFEQNDILVPNLTKDAFYINLTPSVHKTDGFFIARMKKTG